MKKLFLTLAALMFCTSAAFAQTLTAPVPDEITETPAQAGAPPAAPADHHPIPEIAAPTTSSGSAPLEITADTSLDWQRNDKTFIARGNALAKQGDASVAADTLTANYTEKKGGGMQISQVAADGNVVIISKEAKAYGARADYDLDKGYAVMTGDNLRMVSPDQEVTARDKFEYWVKDGKFTAIGNAKVKRQGDTLQADTIAATMKTNEKGQRVLETLEASNNVIIVTPTEMVTGKHGTYNAGTNKAEMTGGVKIMRGPNILEGDRAEVDLATNTSRIFGSSAPGGRVKGIFYPGSDKKPQ